MNVKSSLVVEEAEGIGISRRYLKPPDKMDPSANCQEDKELLKIGMFHFVIAGHTGAFRGEPCRFQRPLTA